jgi:hypothetical protein
MNGDSRGNYVEANGLKAYHEVHGDGRPLILLIGHSAPKSRT